MKDISLELLSNSIIDGIIADNNLLTLFGSFLVKVLFWDNFVGSIDFFKDAFA